jgi:hypothetical protein
LLDIFQQSGQIPDPVSLDRMTVVGSMLHERFKGEELDLSPDRASFCQRYGLDPSRRIIVMFPAGISPYKVKVPIWNPGWSQEKVDNYIQNMVEQYNNICNAILSAGCNLIIKLHPAAYVSYHCKEDDEYELWHQQPLAKILDPEDTHLMYKHIDVGVGLNTNSSMDTGFFKKPFIYIAPGSCTFVPFVSQEKMENCCGIPLGPSSNWHNKPTCSPTPWMTSWLGWFCQLEDLPRLLSDPKTYTIDPDHVDRFIQEFWYKNDRKTAARIADHVIDICESEFASSTMIMVLRRFRMKIEQKLRQIINKTEQP